MGSPAISAVMIVSFLSGLGFFAHRKEIIKQGHSTSLTAVVIKILMPCLIFSSIAGNEKLLHSNLALTAPVMGFCFILFSFILSAIAVKTLFRNSELSDKNKSKAFMVACSIQNYGYFAIPVIQALFPDRPDLIGTLILHNIGVEMALWSVATSILRGKLDRNCWKQMVNAPFITVFIALGALFSGAYKFIPDALSNAVHSVGMATIPIGLMLVGATLSEILQEGLFKDKLSTLLKTIIPSLIHRQILLPLAWLALINAIPMDPDLKNIMLVQAAMPAAFFTIVLTRHFGGSINTVALASVSSFIISPISISIWLSIAFP